MILYYCQAQGSNKKKPLGLCSVLGCPISSDFCHDKTCWWWATPVLGTIIHLMFLEKYNLLEAGLLEVLDERRWNKINLLFRRNSPNRSFYQTSLLPWKSPAVRKWERDGCRLHTHTMVGLFLCRLLVGLLIYYNCSCLCDQVKNCQGHV